MMLQTAVCCRHHGKEIKMMLQDFFETLVFLLFFIENLPASSFHQWMMADLNPFLQHIKVYTLMMAVTSLHLQHHRNQGPMKAETESYLQNQQSYNWMMASRLFHHLPFDSSSLLCYNNSGKIIKSIETSRLPPGRRLQNVSREPLGL